MRTSKTILLVEEDAGLRPVFRDLLEKLDHWVIATPRTGSVPRVLEVADVADLLVADVTVPDSESASLTAALLARRADVAALLISTDDTEFEVRRRFGDRRTRFLLKPFSVEELNRAVEQALALGSHRPAAVVANGGERPSRKRRAAAWGLAAAAVLTLAAGALMRRPVPPLPETVETSVPRGSTLRALEPRGDQPEIPERLGWEAAEDVAAYRVRILAVDDSVIWEERTPAASMTLPPEVRLALDEGVVYFWTVEALDGDGEVTARSPVARFQVVPTRETGHDEPP